ncbi:unnamed protein product [Larinioides sclopetarius]|uniref:Uncharacterized protein n=1 Tax=Larinioides sclopetarius TaxID=280406 RepID=A0AAV2BQK3_9ARAC
MFVERFVYDILVYTLTKCGLPEICLPTTDCTENIYRPANFVKIVGASTLRISLVMRDKWKQIFISRRNSCGFRTEDVLCFLVDIAKCCPLSRTNIAQSLVELLLASCNEIMMYFYYESMDIDFNVLIKSLSMFIIGVIGLNKNYSKSIEELFDSFEDISEYTEWITDFITTFAIPYGSRDDVSYLFFELVRKKFRDDLKKLKDSLGFLQPDLLTAITAEESVNLANPFLVTSDSESPEPEEPENLAKPFLVTGDSESLEPPKLPTSSEICAVGRKKSLESGLENASQHFSQSQESSKISTELGSEYDLRKMTLEAEKVSQEIRLEIAKYKAAHDNGKKKGKDKKKRS